MLLLLLLLLLRAVAQRSARLSVLATQAVIKLRKAKDRYSDAHGFYLDTLMWGR